MEYLQHCVRGIVLKLMLFEKKTYNIARLQRVSLKTGNEELKVIVVKLKRLSCFDWSHGFTDFCPVLTALSLSSPLQTESFIHLPLTSSSSFCYFSNSCWSNCAQLLPLALTVALRRFPRALFSPCSSFPTSQYADWASESSPSEREIKNY